MNKPTDEELLTAYHADAPIICNCTIGYMIEVKHGEIFVTTEIAEVRGPAEAAFVEKVLNVWDKALKEYKKSRAGE